MYVKRIERKIAERRKKKRRERLVRTLTYISLVALIVLSAAALFRFLNSPLFHIRDVVFYGNRHYSDQELRRISGPFEGKNILFFDLNDIRKTLLRLPWIKEVEAEKARGMIIKVYIRERVPLAVLRGENYYYLLDESGRVLEVSDVEIDEGLLTIRSDEEPGYEPGDIVVSKGVKDCLEVWQALDNELKKEIAFAEIMSNSFFFVTKEGVKIKFGDARDLTEKTRVLLALLRVIKDQAQNVKYIDVSVYDYPVVKPKGEEG
jgi:cell division septal protein FtsQ